MGIDYDYMVRSLLVTQDTLYWISISVILYSLLILRRGLYNYRDYDYIGTLMAGYAGKLPLPLQKNVPKRLAVLVACSPNIFIPLLMYTFYMKFDSMQNTTLLLLYLAFSIQKLLLGLLISGYPINIGDVLVEFALNVGFAYSQSATLCYLYDYKDELRIFFILGVFVYTVGFLSFMSHEYRIRSLETKLRSRIVYVRGCLFEWVVMPQLLGEVLVYSGLVIAIQTVASIAQLVFILTHAMILSNMRYRDLKDRFAAEFNNSRRRLIPLIW